MIAHQKNAALLKIRHVMEDGVLRSHQKTEAEPTEE